MAVYWYNLESVASAATRSRNLLPARRPAAPQIERAGLLQHDEQETSTNVLGRPSLRIDVTRQRRARLQNIYAGQIMSSPVIFISDGETVAGALGRMAEEHIKHLPVKADEGGIIGIASQSFLEAQDSSAILSSFKYAPVLRVSEWMHIEAARRLIQGQITALIVTDAAGKSVGIITASDIQRGLAPRLDVLV